MKTRREHIENCVNDLISNFMYYDRKEDESLAVGAIEEAVAAGEITVDEIVELFERAVRGSL